MLRSARLVSLVALLALSGFILLLVGQALLVPSGQFATDTALSAARDGASAAALTDGRVLVSGGNDASGNPLATVEFLGTGTSAGTMAAPRSGHISVALKDGTVLLAGGITTGGAVTNSAEIFNPGTGLSTAIASMLVARSGATATLLPDGRVFIAGGQGSGSALQTTEIYDPASGQFTNGAPLSSMRQNHAAALLNDERVAIAGGSDGTNALNTVDIYDPVANSVSVFASPMAAARTGLSATTLMKGQVLLAGGTVSGNAVATTEILDVTAGTVAPGPSMSAARSGHLALLLPNNNTVLMASGTSASAAAEIYIPWQNAFAAFGTLANPRTDAAGGASGFTGAASVAGGVAGGAASNVVETIHFPMVRTDKPDYQPGDTATITGSGFAPNETVNTIIEEVVDIDSDSPITLAPAPVADANGSFTAQFPINVADLNVRFYLNATGQTSGLTAGMTFTDAAVKLYEATITPTTDTAGHASAGYTLKITNDTTSTQDISSATINVPAQYSSVILGAVTTSPAGLSWTAALSAGVITLTANNGPSHLVAGYSVSLALTATAPCADAAYEWTTATSGNFAIVGSQPSVTITGSCTTGTTTTVSSSLNPSVYGQSVSFTATLTPTAATGSVQFVVDGVNFGGTVAVSGGSATSGSTSTLAVGNHTVTANFTGTGVYTNSNGSLAGVGQTVNQLAVTLTGGSYGPAAYDGNTHALSACVSSAPTFVTCTNNPAGPVGPDVGGAAVSPTPAYVQGVAGDYTITSNSGAWSITKLAVTLTGGSYGPAAYDGNTHALTACMSSASTFVTCTNNPAGPVGADVGGASVSPTPNYVQGSAGDYTLTSNNGSWSITALTVSLTAGSLNSPYNGSAQSPSACVSGAPTFVTCANNPASVGPDVGTGAVNVVSPPTFVKGNASDYTINTTPGTWKITALPVTLTGGGYGPAVYDGNAHALTACGSSAATFVTCTNNPVGPVGPDVGGPTAVAPVPNYVQGSAGDYTLTSNNGSWSITALTVSLTAGSLNSPYNGSAQSPSACVSGAPTFVTCANNPASVGPDVGTGAVNVVSPPTFVKGNASDYTINPTPGTWKITALPVTLTGGSYGPAVYDGNAHALTACGSSAATFVTCTNNPVGPVGPDVGGPTAVAPVPNYVQGSAGDYALTSNNGSWSITALTVSLTAGSLNSPYNGSAQSPSACVSGAPTFVTCANNPASVGPDVGTGAVNVVSPPTFVKGNASDYTINTTPGTWKITALPVTLTGGGYGPAVYDGNAHALTACGSSAATFVTCTNNPVGPVGPDVGGPTAVAPVPNYVQGNSGDYALTSNNGSWSITALTVSLTAGSLNSPYNGSAQSPSACVSDAPTFVTCANNPASVGPDVGTGAVNVVSPPTFVKGNAGDYTINATPGTWKITALPVTLTGGGYGPAVYDGNAHALTACMSSAATFVTCTNNPVGPVGPDVGGPTAVAPVPNYVQGNSGDYALTSNNGSWSITALAVTITGGSYSAAYDGNTHALSACASTSATLLSCTNSPVGPVGPDVGGTPVSPTPMFVKGSPIDYTITSTNGAWSITPLAVTVTGGSYSGIYDGNIHALSACASTSASLLSCTNSPVGPVGPDVGGTPVSPTLVFVKGTATDYTITSNNGAWSITPAQTTTTLSSTLNQTANPVVVTLKAMVTSVTITPNVGTVTFTDSLNGGPGSPLGLPVAVSGGVATLATASLAAGQHVITATYNPPSIDFIGSASGANAAPVATITGPPSGTVQAVNTTVNFTATFTDVGTKTHTAAWSFDTSTSIAGGIGGSSVSGTVTNPYSFPVDGVYLVALTVNDGLGGVTIVNTVGPTPSTLVAEVVIYDPSAGFVTGGGWINSPVGAYTPNPSLTGKASFGFVSQYHKGATVPTGETEFNFQVANFDFHSTVYQWLVVSGSLAQYKGTGTINGSGSYTFLLTARDGALSGGNKPDGMRMKITDPVTSAVIYDNLLSTATDDSITTANTEDLGGGSIVIHSGK